MSLASVCDAIAAVTGESTHAQLSELAKQCEPFLGNVDEITDAAENTLAASSGAQRLMLWFLVDRLAKQHSLFLDSLRPKMISLATHYGFAPGDAEWDDFSALFKSSFSVLFGAPMVSLVLMQLGGTGKAAASGSSPAQQQQSHQRKEASGRRGGTSGRGQTALTVHSAALRRTGAFMTKAVAVDRGSAGKNTLQVKTIDSQMAMNIASSYAPARPVEMLMPALRPDADAPTGHMQALPAGYAKEYEQVRRKRLREIMERNREDQDRRQEEELLKRVRGDAGGTVEDESGPAAGAAETPGDKQRVDAGRVYEDFSDIQMPVEFPRDEYGVKRGNFPLGVRFIKRAIAACGGALELNVLVSRLSSLANREVVAEFGNVREFLLIHSPTFKIELERGQWIVRLVDDSSSNEEDATWDAMTCPLCSKVVKGRNFAKHENCRRCISTQIAHGLHSDFQGRGPIAELAFLAKDIINRPDTFDDYDLDTLASCIESAAAVRRFRLASQRNFAPVLKAMRVVRDVWLARKGVREMDDVVVSPADSSVVQLFRVFGESVHRLPIAWIEMGDIIDMCHRFTDAVRPPFNPPPRLADPRISLQNEYPGFLFCESEVDSEDDPSDGEDEFSDDEAPTFTFAPPVDVAESLFTAGFERDTKRLQHRMRTAPPMVLQRVLSTDGMQTQREAYSNLGGGNGRR